MRTNRLDNSTNFFHEGDLFCARCGQIIPNTTWTKNKHLNKPEWDHCQDCRAKPQQRINWVHSVLGRIHCYPYDGEVDELWRPINAVGDLYRPGERLCGYKDCVNSSHVVAPPKRVIADVELILMSTEIRKQDKRSRTK